MPKCKLPYGLTSCGVGSNNLADEFHIYFMSVHSDTKLYFKQDSLTPNLSEAITTEDIGFAIDELNNLLSDKEFLAYLSDELAPF